MIKKLGKGQGELSVIVDVLTDPVCESKGGLQFDKVARFWELQDSGYFTG